ncbi:MAG: methyltransferase domain-containing protein [Desulfamplus sp.]|nr:methyltransferase domain-containing protein [Desulfamplus sp.]
MEDNNNIQFWREIIVEASGIDYGTPVPELDDLFLNIWSGHYHRISQLVIESIYGDCRFPRDDESHIKKKAAPCTPKDSDCLPNGGGLTQNSAHCMDFLEIGTGFGVLAAGITRLTKGRCFTVEHPSREYFHKRGYLAFLRENSTEMAGCDLKEGLPFKNGSISVICLCDVIEHLHFDDVRTLLDEMERVLVPRGRIIISTPNLLRLGNLVRIAAGHSPNPPIYPETCGQTHGHIREFAPKELARLLNRHGFEIKHRCFGLNPFFSSQAFGEENIFSKREALWIERLTRWLIKPFPYIGDEIYLNAKKNNFKNKKCSVSQN